MTYGEAGALQFSEGISLDEILLRPRFSLLKSRREVNLQTEIGTMMLEYPFVASPMNTVTGYELAKAATQRNVAAYIHRYQSIEKQVDICRRLKGKNVGAAISYDLKRTVELIENGVTHLMMDIANGYTRDSMDYMADIKQNYPDVELISGNIVSGRALREFNDIEVDGVRAGIGAGSVCITRKVGGVGVPTASCLAELQDTRLREGLDMTILQDGGIKTTGDVVKCLALGADAVIIGHLFSQTYEAEGSDKTVEIDGKLYKRYSGMASREALTQRAEDDDEYGSESIHLDSPEGKAELVPIVGSVEDVIANLVAGTQIGFSYVGAKNIKDLREKARFIRL